MMSSMITSLSYQYARSFLVAYGEQLSYKTISEYSSVRKSLEEHKEAWRLIALAGKGTNKNLDTLLDALLHDTTQVPLLHLITLLMRHKRLSLLAPILAAIEELYREKQGITICSVVTAQPLTDEQKKSISTIVHHRVGSFEGPFYKIDKQLIAGIRIQVGSLLWDFSVARQLRQISNALVEECHGN